jgi:branched-chain amino acid transport system ATP-binding protein
MSAEPLFRAEGVSVRYGGVRALSDCSLEVREGQLVGLIGPNGAGKTTFVDAVTGFARSSGRVFLEGREVSRLPPDQRARLGLGRTWQSIELFDDLSVLENLTVTQEPEPAWRATRSLFARDGGRPEEIERAISLLELEHLLEKAPTDLSQGQRKIVGLARALAARPHVVLLDEPAASLDAFESRDLGRRLRQVVDGGVSLLLIDHDMGLVLTVCDYVYVLDFGQLIAQGTPREVRADPNVVTAYLGRAAATEEIAEEVHNA